MNNSTANLLSISCLNWGVQPNYGAALYALCPATSAINDNGTLQSATFKAGGPGYPQFLVMSQSFNYDALNRLTSASDSGGWSRTFNYDQAGNMWVTNPVGGPWSGSTPTTNAFTNNRINGASYDLSGNQLVVNGDTLAYDAENRQSAATDNTTHVMQKYLYDGAGQRVEKTIVGGATTVYVYDIFGLAAEYSTGSNAMTCTTCYPAWDHLGSTRMLMDQNANVIARHDYLPFGEEILANTAGRNSQWGPLNDTVAQKFTGQTRDSETGVDYFNARYFGAALGRFTSPDPANAGADIMNPQSWNAYAYVLGNPLARLDRTGLSSYWNAPQGADCNFTADSTTPVCTSPVSDAFLAALPSLIPTDTDQALNTHLARIRGGGYTCGAPCGWGWVAGDDPFFILGYVGLKAANAVPGAAVAAERLFQQPSCAGMFTGLGPENSAWNLIPQTSIQAAPVLIPADALAVTSQDGRTITFNVPPAGPYFPSSPYLQQNADGAAQTIVHELVHVAVTRYGSNAIAPQSVGGLPVHWTQQDAGSAGAEAINNAIVQGACPVGH